MQWTAAAPESPAIDSMLSATVHPWIFSRTSQMMRAV
jgi:hypothetical protein